jgi:hypothetical protein
MGGEASGQVRQVKHILVLFAICRRSAPRSERFSLCCRCFDKTNWHRIGSSARSGRRVSRPFHHRTARSSPAMFCPACRPRPRLWRCHAKFLGSYYPQPPRIGCRVPAFVSLNASLES